MTIAEVNGLKMYYEVYGKGKIHRTVAWLTYELVAYHTQLARARKVIVTEMQARPGNILRELNYKSMAYDVKHLRIIMLNILRYSMGGE